ncbi:acyl-CoA thioesterase [Verrucomicrobiota bacterium]
MTTKPSSRENYKLVLPEHLNHYGFLFGGYLLKWVDEYAWIAASLDYPSCNFVTIGLDKVEFRQSVRGGTILNFVVEKVKQGNTSLQYMVKVFHGNSKEVNDKPVFCTHVTFVSVDKEGKKKPLNK